ncbi:hypothetical protein H5410_033060 [Solanum commersonii]|uniref:Uncharacterized protein n=1 Tax=Solanum commersonii TaxID=4109 RepID=A0A9J5YML2_SOLCO|nr:hypothetical protein H5410_033060 [Solanum commersonii]
MMLQAIKTLKILKYSLEEMNKEYFNFLIESEANKTEKEPVKVMVVTMEEEEMTIVAEEESSSSFKPPHNSLISILQNHKIKEYFGMNNTFGSSKISTRELKAMLSPTRFPGSKSAGKEAKV